MEVLFEQCIALLFEHHTVWRLWLGIVWYGYLHHVWQYTVWGCQQKVLHRAQSRVILLWQLLWLQYSLFSSLSLVTPEQCDVPGACLLLTVFDYDAFLSNELEGEAFMSLANVPGLKEETDDPVANIPQTRVALTHPKINGQWVSKNVAISHIHTYGHNNTSNVIHMNFVFFAQYYSNNYFCSADIFRSTLQYRGYKHRW